MNVQSRIERVERHTAPFVERARERRVEIEKFRAFIQPDLDRMAAVSLYCGCTFEREQMESDIIESMLLIMSECQERHGYADLTDEQTTECILASDAKFYREVYAEEVAPDELMRAGEIGTQARADMRAGIPANESEAAQQMIKEAARSARRLKKHTDAFAAYIAGLDSRIPDDWTFSDSPEELS